jgi:RNA polymerase sigma factor (sigma-70 family)
MAFDTQPPLGDEAALFDRYQARLVRVVGHAATASRQTVEDACAFAWMQLLRFQPQRRHVFAWLSRVAIREVWRLSGEEGRAALDGEALDRLVSREMSSEERIRWLQGVMALAALRADERELLMLAAAGYSYSEIGEITGHSNRAVERRLKRARRHLLD